MGGDRGFFLFILSGGGVGCVGVGVAVWCVGVVVWRVGVVVWCEM